MTSQPSWHDLVNRLTEVHPTVAVRLAILDRQIAANSKALKPKNIKTLIENNKTLSDAMFSQIDEKDILRVIKINQGPCGVPQVNINEYSSSIVSPYSTASELSQPPEEISHQISMT